MFEPLHDKVLIKEIKEDEKKVGNIILIPTKEKYVRGEVFAVGTGRNELGHFIPTVVKPGQIVLFDVNASQEVTIEGVELFLLRENAIMGTYKD